MKKTFRSVLSAVAATTIAAFGLCACASNAPAGYDDEREKFTVTVNGGTGGGEFTMGDECSVTAYVPRGYKFIEWQNYGYPVSYDNPYKFDVDINVTLDAVIEKLPTDTCSVSVVGGFVGDDGETETEAEIGSTVRITPAESQSRKFVKWLIAGREYFDRELTLTVTKNTVVTAVYDEYCMVAVNGGEVDGSRSKVLLEGSSVTVTATPREKQLFRYWYTLDDTYAEIKVSENAEYTFTLTNSVKLYAKYDTKCSVVVRNGVIKETGEAELDTIADTEYTLVPTEAPDGQVFAGWYKDGVKASIDAEYNITVINDASYEAKFVTPTPDYLMKPTSAGNADKPTSGLIYKEPGGAVALDRVGSGESMFTQGASYVKFYIYDSVDADKADSIGAFKITLNAGGQVANAATLSTMDGEYTVNVVGRPTDYYVSDYDKFDYLLVKALGINTVGLRTLYFAPQLISDNAVRISMDNDDAYILTSGEIADIQTEAYSLNVTKCATPDTSNNKVLFEEKVGGTLAYDRQGGSIYNATVDYVVWYIYTSTTADPEAYEGSVRVGVEWGKGSQGGSALVGYIAQADGTDRHELMRGDPGNYYIIDRNSVNAAIRKALGSKYNADQAYYLAFKVVPKAGAQLESDISRIATNGIKF